MSHASEYWCPRRAETGSTAYGPDTLTRDRGCSYCGSMHPDKFMELVRGQHGGAELGPTTKNYKVYVRGVGGGQDKFYFQHLSEEQMREFVDLYNSRPKRHYDDDMSFTQDEGEGMVIGYPGYFYHSPYFMAPAKQTR